MSTEPDDRSIVNVETVAMMGELAGASKVSGFLDESVASEVQRGILGPSLYRSFPGALGFITQINKAHVLMLERCKIIDRATASALARAVIDLENEGPGAFTLDPAREDSYFNYEAELIRRAGADIGGRLHVARSRNDLKATQDNLAARSHVLTIMTELTALRATLHDRARHFGGCIMPGYTHAQPAQPITFGYYLAGIASALERDFGRLLDGYNRLNVCPLGAAALAGTAFPIDREMTARQLGFDRPLWHCLDAIASRDAILELVSGCALLMTTIGRLAQDFYLMTTFEFATLDLPDGTAITSSIMPQKKNMAAIENLKGRPAYLAGALVTAIAAYKGTTFSHAEDGSTNALRWIWDALEDVALVLPVARLVVATATPRRERMAELVRTNFSTATDLADTLVREAGLSFREAHHLVGRVVRMAMAAGLSGDAIDRNLVQAAALEVLGRSVEIGEEAVRAAVDPTRAIESRRNVGGPSEHDLARLLSDSADRLEVDRESLRRRSDQVARARRQLDEEFAALAHPTARDA